MTQKKVSYFIRKTMVAATLLSGSGLALAGVVTTPPAQTTVPAIGTNGTPRAELDDSAQATGALQDNSAQVWQKTIAAPPSARMQNRSLQAMQKALVSAYQAGQLQTLPPIAGSGGEILYAYGNSLPTLVTAPMHTSIIMLQPGSHPAMATGAPASEWSVHAVMAGDQPEVTIMPKFEGLHTDLVIPATSAAGKPMNYVIELTSDQRHYTPLMGFYYPGQDVTTWNQQASAAAAAKQKADNETVASLPNLTAANLDFDWRVHCSGGGWFGSSDCKAIMPQRVFSDNGHVYIQFKPNQASNGGIPSILAENSAGQNAIINAQFRDGYYIVDSLPAKILLIAGKGSSGKVVKITRGSH
ncbi:TrbG/VirB9 family P-type conjugative transfer protein [Acidithiobacillus ferriphilus]|uniref:TrbG/VirB9 family P-type conjugative transfer protein n=1 Tax=Acidithiobacillus ferriphilus TaxID=1689834 RepID=UPI001D022F48|nr:TrbG/VirB9 family P-type conjugative transfer protein [Acidithiobacillus ferriphilus]